MTVESLRLARLVQTSRSESRLLSVEALAVLLVLLHLTDELSSLVTNSVSLLSEAPQAGLPLG
jgi:hypothetical protein